MVSFHDEKGASLTVLTTRLSDPFGYGRILRGTDGSVTRIVEERDATDEERRISEINSGIYCIDSELLFEALGRLDCKNAQGEFYLTDVVKAASERGLVALPYPVDDPEEVMGVNDRVQLSQAAAAVRRSVNESLMCSGVTMIDPATVYIDSGVTIGRDTILHPNVHISGRTEIGEGCIIESGVVIKEAKIGNGVVVKAGSVVAESVVHDGVGIGPMAHLRPGTELMSHVKIGNFVETKKVVMGEGSKASHLTYLGDASVGSGVNIGCGTITCNYDGVRKHRTVIEDDVFVGSDVQFVAPVTVGRNSLVAAGTTVTKDVPPDSLAIARTPQVNKEGWVKQRAKGKGQKA
jgi:bifunctional UDP-N-acetylglucosamine pyrophosphorylase/glucosamine-1-phosphate N-acetyltransferase